MSTLKANTIQPVSSGVPLVVDSSLRVNGSTSIVSLLAGSATESPTAPLTIRGAGSGTGGETLTLYTRNGVNSYGMRIFEDADSSEWVRFRAMSGNSNSADTAGLQKGFWFSPDDDSCALSIWTRTKGGKVGVYAAADDTSARLKVGIGDYLSLTDYCADFTSDGNDGGWGGILFSQNSTNAFKLWTQGTGSGGGAGRLVLGYVNRSTGALTGGGFESQVGPSSGGVWNPVLMEIRHDTGLVRANSLSLQNFDGGNVAVKPTNAAGTVGQVVPLFTWGGNIGSATVQRNHAAPIPSGTWLVVLSGISETNGQGGTSTAGTENKSLSMAQTWVVPSGKYLVFAHSDTSGNPASATTSGLAWREINASDVGLYRTATNDFPPAQIISANGWNNICKSNGTAQLINEQNADTATGGNKQASGCVYQGGGNWGVTVQVTGYAIRIA